MQKFKLISSDNSLLHKQMPLYDGDYKDIRSLTKDMFNFMFTENGIGLAAIQIGLEMNFFIMNTDKKRIIVNPLIIEESKKKSTLSEGCLSFPDMRIKISRSSEILIAYNDEYGNWITESLDGITARCFLHEYDHTRGKVFTEYKK